MLFLQAVVVVVVGGVKNRTRHDEFAGTGD